MSDKQIVIAIGTGRCGTNSFAKLLNSQPNSFFTHESYVMDWGMQLDACSTWDNFRFFTDKSEGFVGDVTLGLTTQAEQLLTRFSNLKVCCISRDRDNLVESLVRASGGIDNRSFFQSHPSESQWHKDYWYRKFPNFPTDDKRQAIRMFISEYYNRTSALYRQFPDRVFNISVENMNNPVKLKECFDFIGFPDEGRNYNIERINTNTPDGNGLWKNPEQFSIV